MNEADIARHKSILSRHLPEAAVDTIYGYLTTHAVRFHITPERRTKLGYYKCPQPNHQYHEISVNGNLNPYHFLLVLLHEMAHLETFLLYHNEVRPHGHEWQEQYRVMLLKHIQFFPDDLAALIQKYTHRIPLNGTVGKQLEAQMLHYNPGYDPAVDLLLKDLPQGARFRIKMRPQLLLELGEKRRTRYRCVDVLTGTLYLVAANAPVIEE